MIVNITSGGTLLGLIVRGYLDKLFLDWIRIGSPNWTRLGRYRKVDIRLHGKENSNSHGARPVYSNHLDG